MGKVKIHVLYCGGWGYEPKFEAIKVRLAEIFCQKSNRMGTK